MKHDNTSVQNIYIICGKIDMRKGIDGLATLIQDSFELDPYSYSIFQFSGWSKDRYCLCLMSVSDQTESLPVLRAFLQKYVKNPEKFIPGVNFTKLLHIILKLSRLGFGSQ